MDHLIPAELFRGLHPALLLLLMAVSVVALIKGADWLVEGASEIAYRAGVSKVVVGATVMALGTTSPEAAVSVLAAWAGDGGLALGNAVGSVIADTGLIFGIGCLIMRLPADRFMLPRQGSVQFGSMLLLVVLCYGVWWIEGEAATLNRPAGLFLLTLLVGYMVLSVRWGRADPAVVGLSGEEENGRPLVRARWIALFGLVLAGLLVVLFASHVLICCVRGLAFQWGVPKAVIAATLVAFGTSLPELVVGLTAIRKGHPELLVGNVIGADILNILFVVGAAAAASPLPIVEGTGAEASWIFLQLHLPVMFVMLLLMRAFIWRSMATGYFARSYGVPLLGLYVAYVGMNYVLSV